MQRDYSQSYSITLPGMIWGLGNPRVRPGVNNNNASADSWEVAIPVVGSIVTGTTYSITVAGTTVSYKAIAGETQNSLGQNLYNAFVTSPLSYGLAYATYDANTDKITISGRTSGQALAVTASGLTATKTVTAGALPPNILHGRFVARKSNYEDHMVTLPSATSDKIAGAVMSTHYVTRTSLSEVASYAPYATLNVLERVEDLQGIWIEAVDADLVETDAVYVSVASGHEGKVTKNATGTISLAIANAAYKTPTQLVDGRYLVLVSFNLP